MFRFVTALSSLLISIDHIWAIGLIILFVSRGIPRFSSFIASGFNPDIGSSAPSFNSEVYSSALSRRDYANFSYSFANMYPRSVPYLFWFLNAVA